MINEVFAGRKCDSAFRAQVRLYTEIAARVVYLEKAFSDKTQESTTLIQENNTLKSAVKEADTNKETYQKLYKKERRRVLVVVIIGGVLVIISFLAGHGT